MSPAQARSLLGLPPDATRQDADRAFRRLAQVHHPDRGGDPWRFAELVAARAALRRGAGENNAQVVVFWTPRWRRAVRAIARRRFRARQQRATARLR